MSRLRDTARQRPALETRRGVERQLRVTSVAVGDAQLKSGYAQCASGETSGDWGCTGDACSGIGVARQAHSGHDELTRERRRTAEGWQALLRGSVQRGFGKVVVVRVGDGQERVDAGANETRLEAGATVERLWLEDGVFPARCAIDCGRRRLES